MPLENTVSADSIVCSILSGAPDAKSRLLDQYGSGLLFLIERHCGDRAEQFYAAVADATMDAILRREISADDALPKLIQAIFRRLLPDYEEDQASRGLRVLDEIGRTHSKQINEVREELRIFAPPQLQALARFYSGEPIAAICSDLGLSQDHFSNTRKVARQIVQLSLESSHVPRKQSRVFMTKFKTTRKVLG